MSKSDEKQHHLKDKLMRFNFSNEEKKVTFSLV